MPNDEFPDVKPGQEIDASWFNIIFKELRRLRKVKGVDPISVKGFTQGDDIPAIFINPPLGIAFIRTTSLIGAMAGTTPGTGTATIQQFDGTTPTDSPITIDELRNYHDKNVASNSYGGAYYHAGYWWIFDVDKCTNVGV